MRTSTVQFISQTKLGELRGQRERLCNAFDELMERASRVDGVERLKTLVDGLQSVTLRDGAPPLVRDIPNLQALLQGESAPPATVESWSRRLEAIVQQGRRQAEVAYLFGALLGDWDAGGDADPEWLRSQMEAREEILAKWTAPAESAPLELFSKVLSEFADHKDSVRLKMHEALETAKEQGAMSDYYAGSICSAAHISADVREEAKRFAEDHVLESQLSEAMRIASRDLTQWDWPASGAASVALWTRNKWRLYLRLSLVELGLLGTISNYWISAWFDCFSDIPTKLNRMARLAKLRDLEAPQVIIDNEVRMLKRSNDLPDFGWYESVDPWDGTPTMDETLGVSGIVNARAMTQETLRTVRVGGYYGQTPTNPVVHLVHAEIQTLRAAHPDQPIYVVKSDIVDYFTSVSHETLLRMAEAVGVSEAFVDFTRKFLRTPLRLDSMSERLARAQRGVPMEQSFSHWLCECLLRLCERHVHQKASVRLVRQIDDLCILAPSIDEARKAWTAVCDFLADVGLEWNREKSGAIAIGADAADMDGLPDGTPHWGMLALADDGSWHVHEETFARFVQDAQRVIASQASLLAQVREYNQHLDFLASSVGLAMDLGQRHRTAANNAIAKFDAEAFSQSLSAVSSEAGGKRATHAAAAMISELHGKPQLADVDSWLAWPITAGGLALKLAHIITGQYQIAFEKRGENRVEAPETRDEDWQHASKEWLSYYEDQQVVLEPAPCRESGRMNRLVEQFIARGKSLTGGEQEGLSEYWRWVLSIHGASILDDFGTFQFLLTELVPLQLIHEMLENSKDES